MYASTHPGTAAALLQGKVQEDFYWYLLARKCAILAFY